MFDSPVFWIQTSCIPSTVGDLLFWFARYDLYTPKWSKHIFDEWADVMRRKGLSETDISKGTDKANQAFPDALVENYEPLISGLELPDEKDNHVLAAAIKTNANVIVTNNLKDFPNDASYFIKIWFQPQKIPMIL